MVTQAPRRRAVIGALAFTLSCLLLIIFSWSQFGGTIPLAAQGYRIHVRMPQVGLLVPGSDVRISGITIGKVVEVNNQGLTSLITIELDRRYAPIPADSRAILRSKTLLGEAYVGLSQGTPTAPKLPDGGTLDSSHVDASQQLDQVLNSFDPRTQQDLRTLLGGLATGLAGRGRDLNDALGDLSATTSQLAQIAAVVDAQRETVRGLVNDTGTVLTTLGDRADALSALIDAGERVLSATAARKAELTATVNALPAFLTRLRAVLTTLEATLRIARPALDALAPVAPLLRPALEDLIRLSGPAIALLHRAPTLIHVSRVVLPAIARFSLAFRPLLGTLLAAAQEVAPVIDYVSHYSLEARTGMANIGADTAGSGPTIDGRTAHFVRVLPLFNNESSYGQSVREPTNRHNAYYSSGELANILNGGLLSSDCENLGNPSQFPSTSGAPPCRVQPGWTFNGLTRYFPHVARGTAPR